MVAMLGRFAAPEVLTIITDQIRKIAAGEQRGLLTLGFLLALWSSSAALVPNIGTLNLMLWFYLSALVILVGAEMNAEIEHASPYGKDVGEKVPGERRRIGAAAERGWWERYNRLNRTRRTA